MDVIAGLFRPLDKLGRREAVAHLTHGLDGQKLGRGGGTKIVHDVNLVAGMRLADKIRRLTSGVDAGGKATSEGEVNGRDTVLGHALEHLEVVARRNGRRRHVLAGTHALIKLMRRHGAPEVVHVLPVLHYEREMDDLDAEGAGYFRGKVRA